MPTSASQAEHNRHTRDAYDRLAAVWTATGPQPSQEALERYPAELAGTTGVPVCIVCWLRLALPLSAPKPANKPQPASQVRHPGRLGQIAELSATAVRTVRVRFHRGVAL